MITSHISTPVTDSVLSYRFMEPLPLMCRISCVSCCILAVISYLSAGLVSHSRGAVPQTATICDTGSSSEKRNFTHVPLLGHLACMTAHVFSEQNLLDNEEEDDRANHLLAVLFDVPNTRLATYFMRMISRDRFFFQFITFQTENGSHSWTNHSEILKTWMKFSNEIKSVVFFSHSLHLIVEVLEAVSLSEKLRYTGVLHTTEWLIVLTELVEDIPSVLLQRSRTVDFITLLFMHFTNTTLIAQQSRTQNLTIKAKVVNYNMYPGQRVFEAGERPGTSCGVLRSPKDLLRKSAWWYLQSQKSVLDGMELRVAVTPTIVGGNMTNTDRHAMAILKLMTASLGFSSRLMSSSDGSVYGILTPDTKGTGISGLLARREADLTPMPFSMTDNRLKAIAYIPVSTFAEQFFIFYRWPRRNEKIDLIYIYVMQLEFIYLLIGTILFLSIIGAIVHLATTSCTLQFVEPFSMLDPRRLSSCLDHACFRYPGTYVAHSGRILLACWAVFIVVLGAAYSAFLVTDFVVFDSPPINSLKQLNARSDFKVGIRGASELTRYVLNNTNDDDIRKLTARLQHLNQSDPETFSPDSKVHVRKILAGGYAAVGSSCVPFGMCENFIPDDVEDLVSFPVEDLKLYADCFVATTKDAFFQEDLYKLLLRLQELGILEFLSTKYVRSKVVGGAFVPLNRAIYQTKHESSRVGLLRIQFVVYVAVAGVAAAGVCLLAEILMHRLTLRHKSSSSDTASLPTPNKLQERPREQPPATSRGSSINMSRLAVSRLVVSSLAVSRLAVSSLAVSMSDMDSRSLS